MLYTLPILPYAFDALDPYIDAKTMEIHYTKHHQGYIDNLNKALAGYPELQAMELSSLLQNLDMVPETIRTAVRNHGGGHHNHTFFWDIMSARQKNVPCGQVADRINETFGSFDRFKELFSAQAKTLFGSGWCWLVIDKTGRLIITTTHNQDTPLMQGMVSILGLDVWEHAYYLKYQSKRADYIDAWWHVVDWERVEDRYRQVVSL